ncbi:linear amide C-N hydrolase [Sulfurovum riftiae]|uniref:Choloylglycine hydrolase/NAAA C-terminal domain-containing protein n=1 Tax=Sulfurovum riftiae TaxID=1630136 RepID=A0A151CGZ2_9BACT|nr:choloylglycine hydrolase family protein [Sulfurovum riftiae]KYJ86767.1 hypothetical protein AS592_08030 [Sulfurovum riftiae]
MKKILSIFGALAFAITLFVSSASACSSFRISSEDGHHFFVFNFELGGKPGSEVVYYPRGTEFTANAPKGLKPAQWKSKYAVVGMDWFDQMMLVGGINEHGLAAANLNLPNYTEYQKASKEDNGKILAAWDVPTYFLTQFKNVEEVKAGFKDVKVVQQLWNIMGGEQNIEFHYTFQDPSGASIVVEYIKGEPKIYDNPLGVMTNSPDLAWQHINLNNYINLTAQDILTKKVGDKDLIATGMGTGMLGLPGDFTPVSRFVRAVAFTQTAQSAKTHDEALKMAIRISNTISFPEGVAKVILGDMAYTGKTDWVMIGDLSERKMYFRHYDYLNWRVIDLKELMKINTTKPLYFDLKKGPAFEDVSSRLAPKNK